MSNDIKNKLRERMQKIKDGIDIAEDREHEGKEQLKKVEDQAYQLESERTSKGGKISMAQKLLDEKNAQVRKIEERLREIEGKCERENELVKTLEVMEIDGDEKLNDLEKQTKTVNDIVENKELQNKEMALRLAQLENELEKVSRNYFCYDLKHVILRQTNTIAKFELRNLVHFNLLKSLNNYGL